MKIEHITINGKEHPLCCGLYVLSYLQKTYGTLDDFIGKLTQEQDGKLNFDVIIDTLKKMNECGAKAENVEPMSEDEIGLTSNPYGIIETICKVYSESLLPENPEAQSQTKTESDR